MRQVDPRNGNRLWQTGLPCPVMGTPSLDSAGVLAVGTFGVPLGGGTSTCSSGSGLGGAYLLDAATGNIVNSLFPVSCSCRVFAQPVFAQGNLFVATERHGLYSFAP